MMTNVTVTERQYSFALVKYVKESEAHLLRPTDKVWIARENPLSVKGCPGTWVKPPKGVDARWFAIVCCPNCSNPIALGHGTHDVGKRSGKVRQPIVCECGFNCTATLNGFAEKSLYACAFAAEGKAKILYMHATSIEECKRRLIGQGHKGLQILAIGLALGYYTEEVDGRIVVSTN